MRHWIDLQKAAHAKNKNKAQMQLVPGILGISKYMAHHNARFGLNNAIKLNEWMHKRVANNKKYANKMNVFLTFAHILFYWIVACRMKLATERPSLISFRCNSHQEIIGDYEFYKIPLIKFVPSKLFCFFFWTWIMSALTTI